MNRVGIIVFDNSSYARLMYKDVWHRLLIKALFLFLCLWVNRLVAQLPIPVPPDTEWTATFGGLLDDRGQSVEQTSDGGYIITGYTNSFGGGNYDFYLIKTSATGSQVWAKTYGGLYRDQAYSVEQTSDGGYIITGYTGDNGDSANIYLIKTDSSGQSIWAKTYGSVKDDYAYSVEQTSDGGYIIAGYTTINDSGDVYLIKTDDSGKVSWQETYGGSGLDKGYAVQQTSDGGYIIAGCTSRFLGDANNNIYIFKVDSAGQEVWKRTYGGEGLDKGYSVQQTSDGGYIIAGMISNENTGLTPNDIYLIKINADGDSVWARSFGGTGWDEGYTVRETSDRGFIIAGSMEVNTNDVYLIKTDSLGWIMWSRTYGGLETEKGYSVQQTLDGGYVITGYTCSFGVANQDVYLLKTKPVLKLISPDGGEFLKGGSTYAIEWKPENPPASVYNFRLFFSTDGDSVYADTIAQALSAGTRSFNWVVPNIDAGNCRVKLELVDAGGNVVSLDVSDSNFVIDITAPIIDSTTIWNNTSYPGPFEISTKVTDNLAGVDSVVLYYRRDEDGQWNSITMNHTTVIYWCRASIPAVAMAYDTVRYYIKAFDKAQNVNTDPLTDYYSFVVDFTGIEENRVIPRMFLFDLRNNPVKGKAIFNLSLPLDATIDLWIYDVAGRIVDKPVSGEIAAGQYEIPWNSEVSSGIYFYTLRSPWQFIKGKMVFLH